MLQYNELSILDILTILSFIISLYALELGLENLEENRAQSKSQSDLLEYLEQHLQNQDDHLKAQDELLKRIGG